MIIGISCGTVTHCRWLCCTTMD